MSCCLYITKALILAFFALNAFNTFNNTTTATAAFKTNYANFEETVKSRFGVHFPASIQAGNVGKHAFDIVRFSAIAQLALSFLGVFWGCASGLVGLIFLLHQVIQHNFAKINPTSTSELEKIALPIALVVSIWALSCCGSKGRCSKKGNRHSNESESSVQANTKKRH